MMRLSSYVLALALTALTGCGAASYNNTRSATAPSSPASGTPDSGDQTGIPGTTATASGTDTGSDEARSGSTATGSATGTTTGTGTGTNAQAGQAYFNQVVAPVFEAKCSQCHADPRMQVAERGPLTIFSYASMKPMLSGGSVDDNGLYNKIRDVVPHTGGDQCPGGDTASPCKELVAWWHTEFGDAAGDSGRGKLTSISAIGQVAGYAYDPTNTATEVSVNLYSDGAKGTGTSVGTVVANAVGDSGLIGGNHNFTFQLPATVEDGKPHTLYAYAVIGGTEEPLGTTDTGMPFTAWTFTTAGRNYFTATVAPKMSACTGCHTVAYEQQFYSLISAAPNAGGTATNNQLINKPSQTNSTTHGGGLRCATINTSPCTEFQAWWKLEFGG